MCKYSSLRNAERDQLLTSVSFFTGCHYFVPLWDKTYDTFETYTDRTPFSTNGKPASKSSAQLMYFRSVSCGRKDTRREWYAPFFPLTYHSYLLGPLGQTFHRCLEEAQGIARSTLFGPIVRKEAVMAMLILSVWSQNGWLPCG
jgi:hypothetical protein